MGKFNQYLSEASKADAIKLFGTDDLWKSYKNYIHGYIEEGDEEYNARTFRYWESVRQYYEYGTRNPKIYNSFNELLTYKKHFPELQPDSVWAFRGISRTKQEFEKMNLRWREFDKNWLVADSTYTNKTGLSSWTIKEPIAWTFALNPNEATVDSSVTMTRIIKKMKFQFGDVVSRNNAPPLTEKAVWKQLTSGAARKDIIALQSSKSAVFRDDLRRLLSGYKWELFDSILRDWYSNTMQDFDYGTQDYKIPMIMQAKVDKDFLFSSTFANKITKDTVQQSEYEITRVSKAPIKVEYFMWKTALPSNKKTREPNEYRHEDIADFIGNNKLYDRFVDFWSSKGLK